MPLPRVHFNARITPQAHALLLALAELHGSQGKAIERLLDRYTPPDTAGEAQAKVRRLHKALKEPGTKE